MIKKKYAIKYSTILIVAFISFSCDNINNQIDPTAQVAKIKDMNELGTVEYIVTKVISGNDDLTWYKVGNRKILFSCQASIKAGVDFSKLKKEDIEIENKNVNLKLPKAKIIYVNIDHKKIKEVYNDTDFFRSQFSNKEKDDLLVLGEKSIQQAIPKMGILEAAESNAEKFLGSFLRASGFTSVSVEFY